MESDHCSRKFLLKKIIFNDKKENFKVPKISSRNGRVFAQISVNWKSDRYTTGTASVLQIFHTSGIPVYKSIGKLKSRYVSADIKNNMHIKLYNHT